MIGNIVGNYKIVEKIGEGGMGQVFRAVDTMLEREVAIKILHRHLTQEADRLQRFRSEAVTLAKLNHPNIATLYNFFEHQGDYFMVMEHVDGETFESLLVRLGALPLRQALELFCQSLQGFEHAHSKQVIHRDIKPSNLMLNSSRVVKITDFGIARVLGTSRLTQTGRLIGTLEYMSPEQVQGLEQDMRSDIYSLGILLYEMMLGRVPFSSTSDFEIMRAHLEVKPISPRELISGLPEEVDRAIQLALEKNPAARFQKVREFRLMLERAIERLPEAAMVITPKLKETRVVDVIAPPPAVKETRLSEHTQESVPPAAPTGGAAVASGAVQALKRLSPKVMMAGGAAVLAAVIGLVFLLRPSPAPKPPSREAAKSNTNTAQGGAVTGGGMPVAPPVVQPAPTNPVVNPIVSPPDVPSSIPTPGDPAQVRKPSGTIPPKKPERDRARPDRRKLEIEDRLTAAETAFRSHRFVEPQNDNVVDHADMVLRLDPNNARARELTRRAVAAALNDAESDRSRGNLRGALEKYRLLSNKFPDQADFRTRMRTIENQMQEAARAQETAGAQEAARRQQELTRQEELRLARQTGSAFQVVHDHGAALSTFCTGVLSVSPNGIEYRTTRTSDGRTDDFTVGFADIKEAKRNRLPVGGYSMFHIKLQNGSNYNFAHVNGTRDLGPDPVLAAISNFSRQK